MQFAPLLRWLASAIAVALLWLAQVPVHAAGGLLVSRNPVTDPRAILRHALPVNDPYIRQIESSLEDIHDQLKAKRWRAIASDVKTAQRVLAEHRQDILAQVAPENQAPAQALLDHLAHDLDELSEIIGQRSRTAITNAQADLLDHVGAVEALMVKEFPFEIPPEYQHLPQLLGRATVKMVTNKGDLVVVLDGYNAPITAGNFLDLVQQHFYDHLPFTRAEESFVVQAGDPPGEADGYVDPRTGTVRRIPLEIRVEGDPAPLYGTTLEAAGRYLDQPVLPFAAYGTLAMARNEFDPNSASSQFFFLRFENELTPPGINLLDGRYAVFGYLIDGQDVLEKIRPGDEIQTIEILDGAEHLVNATPLPSSSAAALEPILFTPQF